MSLCGSISIEAQSQTKNTTEEALLKSTALRHFSAVSNSNSEWTSTFARAPLAISPQNTPNHLTAATLSGPDKLTRPFVFFNDVKGAVLAVYHLGAKLEGHAGMIHGGMIATLLDECMGRACFPLFPSRIAVTARFEMDFRKPIPSGSIVVLSARTEDISGRKAWVVASIEDQERESVLVQARALFVEPLQARDMARVM